MTTGQITKSALEELTLRGFECWRQNQIPVRGRAFTGKKGLPDIIGFQIKPATSIFLGAEVKNKGDKLRPEQIELLDKIKKAGGFTYIVTLDDNGKFIIKNY